MKIVGTQTSEDDIFVGKSISDTAIIKLCFSSNTLDKILGVNYLFTKYPQLNSQVSNNWVEVSFIKELIKTWPQTDCGRWSTPGTIEQELNY